MLICCMYPKNHPETSRITQMAPCTLLLDHCSSAIQPPPSIIYRTSPHLPFRCRATPWPTRSSCHRQIPRWWALLDAECWQDQSQSVKTVDVKNAKRYIFPVLEADFISKSQTSWPLSASSLRKPLKFVHATNYMARKRHGWIRKLMSLWSFRFWIR